MPSAAFAILIITVIAGVCGVMGAVLDGPKNARLRYLARH